MRWRIESEEKIARGVPTSEGDPALCAMNQEEKLGATAIARRLGIGRASVYRVLGRLVTAFNLSSLIVRELSSPTKA